MSGSPRRRSPPPSRRVAWPEPDRPEGGEFRITWGRAAAILTTLVALAGAIPLWWTVSDHWMNRAEIQAAMKTHADHDASVQAWNQFGFADNRAQYLADKAAECDAKRMVSKALGAADLAICSRYESQLKLKQDEAAQLKSKALESTKEKQP